MARKRKSEETVHASSSHTSELSNKKRKKNEKTNENNKESSSSSPIMKELNVHSLPSKEILNKLLDRIENHLPKNDSVKYDSRSRKLDWESIAFEEINALECQRIWTYIQERIRRFRIIAEMIPDARAWAQQPWKNFYASKGQNRHPDLPKKPLTTYMLFYSQKRSQILEENPNLPLTEVSKRCSEMYSKLSQKKKNKIQAKYDAMKTEYDEKLHQFYEHHPELKPPSKADKRKAIALNKKQTTESEKSQEDIIYDSKYVKTQDSSNQGPKKPYELFLQSRIESSPGVERAVITDQCRKEWKTLKDKKKAKWIKLALQGLRAYVKENPTYCSSSKEILTLEEQKFYDKYMGRPEKPAASGYSLFSREMFQDEEIKSYPSKERMAKISEKWKNLPLETKTKFQKIVNESMALYRQQYEEWFSGLNEEERRNEASRSVTKPKKFPTENSTESKLTSVVKKDKKMEKKKKDIIQREPTGVPGTRFRLFLSESKNKDVAKLIWKNMSDSEKKVWSSKLKGLRSKFLTEYKNFVSSLDREELEIYSEIKELRDEKENNNEDSETDSSSSSESEEDSD